jgi:hypothetical protein
VPTRGTPGHLEGEARHHQELDLPIAPRFSRTSSQWWAAQHALTRILIRTNYAHHTNPWVPISPITYNILSTLTCQVELVQQLSCKLIDLVQ